MIEISGTHKEVEELMDSGVFDFTKAKIKYLDLGSVSDMEIDSWGSFSEYERQIIKEQYSKYPTGFFANPFCALR